ncbi:MAG: hypothetical protein CMM77_12610 [Rhodospirillaceae bacterium]|nr:hypothetical protein [Magnetovibrio sp.]MAY67955.1 hypothetical protein [Rhodospirillaceae bacterium]
MGTIEQNHALPPAGPTTTDQPNNVAEPGLPGVGGADGMGGYGRTFLKAPVGRGQENRADDVGTVSGFLAENGLMPAATREADEDFLSAIEKGQKKLNGLAGDGLRVDGIVKPWGPTEILSQRAVSSGKMKAPGENMPAKPGPGASGVMLQPDTPDEMLARLQRKNPDKKPAIRFQPIANVRHLPGGGIQGDLPPAVLGENSKPVSGNQVKRDLSAADRDAIMSALRNLGDNAILLLGQILRVGTPTVVTPTLENPGRYFIKDAEKGA